MSADDTFKPPHQPVHPDDVRTPEPRHEPEPYRGEVAVSHPGPHQYPPMPPLPVAYRDTGTAWLLLVFLGGVGGHDFYLRSPGIGATKLIFGILSGLLTFVFIGYLGIFAIFVWNIVDAFRMSGRVRTLNEGIHFANSRAMGHRPH